MQPGAPGTATALQPEDLGLLPPAPYCPEQEPAEPQLEYAGRVLAYALTYGIGPLTCNQLETADARAVDMIASLPQQVDAYAYTSLDQDGARLYETLHTLRGRIARQLATKRAQLAAINRQLDAMDAAPPDADDEPQAPEQTEQERALNLLRAALMMIMGPQPPNGGGGRPARLQPPAPVRPGPAGGIHADDRPNVPPGDGIAF